MDPCQAAAGLQSIAALDNLQVSAGEAARPLFTLVQAFRKGCSLLHCSPQTCAAPDTAVSPVQPFLLAAMHIKVTSLAIVGVYLFEPISTSPEDPQILQVRLLHRGLQPGGLLHQQLIAASTSGYLHVF